MNKDYRLSNIRVTADQADRVKKRALELQMSVSEYIRFLIYTDIQYMMISKKIDEKGDLR